MNARRFGLCLAVLAATSIVSPAVAAPRASRPTPPSTAGGEGGEASTRAVADAARTTFTAGLKAYKKKKYNDALAAFLQSYALSKNPAVLVNLGLTHLRLGNPLDAARYFLRFLDEAKDATPELRARVTQNLTDARKQLGSLEISAPEGAEISVDGDVVGRTPLPSPIDVLPGKHEVTMSSTAGTKTEQVDVAIGPPRAIKLMPQVTARPAAPVPVAEGEAPESPGFLSPPRVVAPVYIAGAIGLVAFTGAIVLNGIRVNADRNATTATEALVRNGKSSASCFDGSVNDPTIGPSCTTIKDSQRIMRNTTVQFNTSIWVGVGASVAALGWYFIAPKPDAASPSGAFGHGPVQVAPLVGPRVGGASVSGSF